MVVAPVSTLKGSKSEAALLISDGKVCGPGQVAKQVLGRPHVSFRGLGHGPRQLVDRVEDVVAGDLCEVYHHSSDRLVAPLLFLVQQILLRLVQGQFRTYSGGVGRVAAFYTVVLYEVLRIVFLTNGDDLFLMVAGDVHAEDLRKSLHDESTLVGTVRLSFEHPPGANNFMSRRDQANHYHANDAVLPQSRNLLVRCCLSTRRLGATRGLLEGVRDTVRLFPSQTARLRVNHGVGDFGRNRLGMKLMRSIRRARVGVET